MRTQVLLLGIALLLATVVEWSPRTPYGLISGQPKGTDFVHFYSLAVAARSQQWDALVAHDTLHQLQGRLVPFAADLLYPPVYPPQVAFLLAPFGALAYFTAYALWVATTVALYAMCVWALARRCPSLRAWPSQVACCALAFPPFIEVLWHGQISVLALGALTLSFVALHRGARFAAGCALGLLGFKYSFAAPVVAMLMFASEWRMLAGVALAMGGEFLVVAPIVGLATMSGHFRTIWELAQHPAMMAAKPYLMHSLRAFWDLSMPAGAAGVLYVVSSGVVLVVARSIWRGTADPALRVATLAVTVALVSPHLYVYDLVIIVPTLLVAADYALARPQRGLQAAITTVFVAPLFGAFVRVFPIQVSTIALVGLLVIFRRIVVAETVATPTAAPVHVFGFVPVRASTWRERVRALAPVPCAMVTRGHGTRSERATPNAARGRFPSSARHSR